MIVLHGIYDNGKIEIEEKDLPKGKASFEIKIEKDKSTSSGIRPAKSFRDLPAFGMWKDRPEMADSTEYISSQRVKIQQRKV